MRRGLPSDPRPGASIAMISDKEEFMKVKTNVRAGSVSTVATQILQQAQSVRTAALQNLR